MAACVLAGQSAHAAKTPKSVRVKMETSDARYAGEAILVNKSGGVQFHVDFQNLDPGKHGIHVHQFPKCDAPTFQSAGPHFNPYGKQHGYQNPNGHHAGDIQLNLTVGDAGTAKQTFFVKGLTLKPGAPNSVFANGGTSLIIHSGPDDMKTDPSGNSGSREACGIISIDNASNKDLSMPNTNTTHIGPSNE